MDISIIIVNYNTKEDLRNCLESVYHAQADLNIQTIVIDNNSKDGSAEMVETSFPDVELIANKDNVGFVAANNQGLRRADGRYILLLNPDTILYNDTLKKSVEYMDKRPDVGCLGIKTLTTDGDVFPNGATFPSEIKTLARLFMLKEILPNTWIKRYLSQVLGGHVSIYADRNEGRDVDMVGGFYMFLRSDVVRHVGELDEAYWADIEDSDYCFRLKQAGWKVVYWPGADLIHIGGRSIERKAFSLDTYLRVNTNIMLFFKKHYSLWRFFVLRSIFIFGVLPQILIAFCLPVCLGLRKAQIPIRIRAALKLAKRALILPDEIRYAK